MRFTNIFLAGALAIVASAQDPTTTDAAPAPASTVIDDKTIQCLEACSESDTACRAKCVPVPNPNDQDVNDTTACVAACPVGNGTDSDNAAYAQCRDKCIGDFYYNPTDGSSGSSSGSGSGSSSGSGSGSNSGSGSSSGSDSSSNSSDSTSDSDSNSSDSKSNSSDSTDGSGSEAKVPSSATNVVVSSVFGLVGLAAAFFAL